MQFSKRSIAPALVVAMLSTGIASAQTTPYGGSGASPMPMSSGSPIPMSSASPASSSSAAPSGQPSAAPGSTGGAKEKAAPSGGSSNPGEHKGQVKQIKSGSLSFSQTAYAVTHPIEEAKKLKGMGTVDFDNLRIYHLPTSVKGRLKISQSQLDQLHLAIVESSLPPAILVAQATPSVPTTNGSNSPLQFLHNVLANVNVSNALNNLNVLNNSTLNIPITLSNVLNNNKVAIGQVVGLYIGGGGIVTTIVK